MWISRPWLIALVLLVGLSLATNFFVGGLWLGQWRGAGPAHPIAHHLRKSLPAAARPLMRQQLRSQQEDLRQIRHTHHAARLAVAEALRQEPFDAQQLRMALARMRQSTDQAQQRLHNSVAQVAQALSPEDRQLWAEQWERPPRRGALLAPPTGRHPPPD